MLSSSSSSSSTVLFSPVLSINFKSTSRAPPRVRLPPPLALAGTTTAYSTEKTISSTCTYRRPHRMASLYEILGIPTGASCQEVKIAYRRLARVCHPDVAAIDQKNSSTDAFLKIHTAYSTLSDPEKRAVYDQKLFRRSRPLTSVSGYSGRNWETDQCW